ncbi:MAG TPA: CocE/NonD family hydrolase [Candidatus Limnocylindria bacterium]|nr:CocE/NonD family hydrolase [Candidatus Limnocylindria bacterium]
MKTDEVTFYSEGVKLHGFLHRPDAPSGRLPFIVQGPGWLGLADAKLYRPYHEAFADAGFAVLIFDYRGFGSSEGDRGTLSPAWQLEDWRNAIAYMRGRHDIDGARGAVFGSGGTGGGNAVLVGAYEPALRATISQVPVADGRDWLHRMRQEHEWIAFLASVEADRRARAAGGEGTAVHPREGIMVATPERRATAVKSDVDSRIPTAVPLAAAQAILEYRPIDVAHRLRGLMVIGVADDAVTPTDHAERLYEAAAPPKQLVLQRNTSHYTAYTQYASEVIPLMVDWLRTLVLRDDDIEVRTESGAGGSVRFIGAGQAGGGKT